MNSELKKEMFPMVLSGLGCSITIVLGLYFSGIIVPSHVLTTEVAQARIDVRATFCKEAAMAHYAELGTTAPLNADGMQARQVRDSLADQFLVPTGDTTRDRLVRDACSAQLLAT